MAEKEVRLIDANALLGKAWDDHETCVVDVCDIEDAPTIDPESLRPQAEWGLSAYSSIIYNDFGQVMLSVYVVAKCSRCGECHPDDKGTIWHTFWIESEDFIFDVAAKEAEALEKFKNIGFKFAKFCSNCGAKMEV